MTRKANGESSIGKGSDGRWHGFVSLGQREHGKADRRHVSAKTRSEVVAKVRALEQKRDAGLAPVAGKPMTVGEWMDHWLTIAKRSVRVKRYVGYECYVRLHIKPALGHIRQDRLQPEHLEAFYAHLADGKGLSPSMQLQQHRVISRALKVALQRGRVARNVATLVQAPTAATLLLELGVDARIVMEILGHSQITLTRTPTSTSCRRSSPMPRSG